MTNDFETWLNALPKAELHLHIDGSLQAHRLLSLAAKNHIDLPYSTVAEVEEAYEFEDLQSFLDLYYLGGSVLIEEDDFYHLMMDYLLKCKEQNIVHCEIMVEPQTYAPNGVSFTTMMDGFNRAIDEAKNGWSQSVCLILSFLRHLSEHEALATLREAEPYKACFTAIGLASAELGNPPEKFEKLYSEAAAMGYLLTAHAGEEGPAQFIWNALTRLGAERIDHGVSCVEDPELVSHLIENRTALTVCPLSNIKLCVFDKMYQHNILDMLDRGLAVTVNSDDPAYFGGYLNENFYALHMDLNMTQSQAIKLIENSFVAAFLSEQKKQAFIAQLKSHAGLKT